MNRPSPLLERHADTVDLPLAPQPWRLCQCKQTGLVFLANPPGYEALKEDQAWEVNFRREQQARKEAEPLRYALSTMVKRLRHRMLNRRKVETLATTLITQIRGDRLQVVDVGCGWGDLLGKVMDGLGASDRARCVPAGVEISTELARLSNEALSPYGGRCIHAPAVDGLRQFGPASNHLIVLSSFLEHELEPMALLRECTRTLVPGGYVIVKVPNYASWNRTLRGPRWCGFRWPDHVNYFTPATLRQAAEAAGLQVTRMGWRDRFPLSDSLYAVLQKPA